MKRSIRTLFIVLIATMTMALAAVSVNAAATTVTKVDIKESTTLALGKSEGLALSYAYIGSAKPKASTFKWKSSNTKVVTVSNNGVIKAKKKGTAEITVTANGKKDTCVVEVVITRKWVDASSAYTELNKLRKNRKFKALKIDKTLEKIAMTRAKEMAEHNKFSHTRPNGKSGLTLIKGNKYKGENIARGQKNGVAVTKAWYNSKGHRANMLRGNAASKHFTKVGIACYELNGVTYWAQVFSS